MSSVVGFAGDLDATEMLYTSLLVQAQTALHATSGAVAAGARARSRSFRGAFLRAYAQRVGERLDEINSRAVADTEAVSGRSILPVLAARSEVVDSAVEALFGRLGRSRARRSFDSQGWQSGRAAADRARLHDRAVSG